MQAWDAALPAVARHLATPPGAAIADVQNSAAAAMPKAIECLYAMAGFPAALVLRGIIREVGENAQ
jgi:hypothetical protein